MAILLNQLAYEEPAERIPFVPDARDEVNVMAQSVNTMADHKMRFIAWWQTTTQEADACQKLEAALTTISEDKAEASEVLQDAEKKLSNVIVARCQLLSEQYDEISRLTGSIVVKTSHLLDERPTGKTEDAITDIRHCANLIQDVLEMVTFQESMKKMEE
ncbi:MAG: hypothetical protein EP297_11390 [Gammaproteobacteria bacterium]|nr:MAG: hypothetical protein EP297_11390 [Gammaproteobacteria bacterium]